MVSIFCTPGTYTEQEQMENLVQPVIRVNMNFIKLQMTMEKEVICSGREACLIRRVARLNR